MPEKLALQQARRKRRAVDRDERLLVQAPPVMHDLRRDLFARARLAEDEDWIAPASGQRAKAVPHPPHAFAPAEGELAANFPCVMLRNHERAPLQGSLIQAKKRRGRSGGTHRTLPAPHWRRSRPPFAFSQAAQPVKQVVIPHAHGRLTAAQNLTDLLERHA